MSNRNATSSWSGYLHQGKVGILIALRKINEILDSDGDLKKWLLEYESAEDVDIKHDDSIESRHQIKAYKDGRYPNNYKDVLRKSRFKIENNEINVIYFGFQTFNLENFKIEVDENSRFLHTIREVQGFGLDENTFKSQYSAKYIENPNMVQLYTYPNGQKFCSLANEDSDDIMKFCVDEIKNILTRQNNHVFINDDNEHENIFKNLLGILDNQIRLKHIRGSAFYPVLRFEDIHRTIVSTVRYTQNNMEIVREIISDSWTSFISEAIDEGNLSEKKIDEVNDILNELFNLNEDDFIQFMQDINPDKTISKNLTNVTDISKICNFESFKDIFYECLVLVNEEKFEIGFKGYRSYDPATSFLLTLINRRKSKIKHLISAMWENNDVTENIYTRGYLINSSIDNIRFGEHLTSPPESQTSSKNWKKSIDEKEKILNPSLEFISVDRAIQKLNGG